MNALATLLVLTIGFICTLIGFGVIYFIVRPIAEWIESKGALDIFGRD